MAAIGLPACSRTACMVVSNDLLTTMPTKPHSSRKPTDERRREVADAALEIIAQKGISTLTTASIARAVGLTPGALFRHFASIEEILVLAVDRAVDELDRTYPAEALSPTERITAFIEARIALATRKLGIPRLVLSDQFAHALPTPARQALRRAIERSRTFVAEAIAEGQRDGVVRADLDAGALALVVLGTVQMAILRATMFPRSAASHDVGALVLTLLAPPKKGTR